MITVINGTNRWNNNSHVFAKHLYQLLLNYADEEVKYLGLDQVPHDWFFPEMYEKGNQAKTVAQLQDEFISAANKFYIISPEYNGGMPGALKLFIDAISVRNYGTNFKSKKVALVGTASGRAGNLRGMDQLTHILQHMGAIVMPQQLPISRIETMIQENAITDTSTLEAMEKHALAFVNF
ncbi:MAG: NAD(P)H-dependent oxidoreductase [Saprospiraceae bacterium]|nr:NAD(P)H-dependent oxidoreductase [Saprospiraceae bacterium]